MPSKGSKRAARQAKVRQQRRRGRGAVQTFKVGPIQSSRPETNTTDDEHQDTQAASHSIRTAAMVPSPHRKRPPTGTATLSYNHIGREVKRIGATSVVILVLLGLSSFFLGSF